MGRKGAGETRENAVRSTVRLSAILCICMVTGGCGYSFANSRLSNDYRTVAVPAFKNKSFEPEIHILVTDLLIRELQADGRFRVVDDPGSADLVLRGAITGFDANAMGEFFGEPPKEYVEKPVEPAKLLETVRRVLAAGG